MATVTISEAARLSGKSTKTLYRMASQGRLSVSLDENGAKIVETSELVRVFGRLRGQNESRATLNESHGESQNETSETVNISILEARIKALEDAIVAKNEIISQQKDNLSDLRQAMLLLENRAPVKKPWWKFGN